MSGRLHCKRSGSLCPLKRTDAVQNEMSAKGQKRTFCGSPTSGPTAGTAFFHQCSQRSFGRTALIEIRRREPSFHDFADLWPLVVKDGVPSRIPISALEDHVVMENSLKAEAKPTRCRTRGCI